MENQTKKEITYKTMEEFREKFPPAKFDYPFETTKQTTEMRRFFSEDIKKSESQFGCNCNEST